MGAPFRRIAKTMAYGVGLVVMAALGCGADKNVTVVRAVPVLDEAAAVSTTADALRLAGFEPAAYRAVPFRDGEPATFARNTRSPRSGYVLWARRDSSRVWDIMVRCDWQPTKAQCHLSDGK